jgi:hypothetical protein
MSRPDDYLEIDWDDANPDTVGARVSLQVPKNSISSCG